MHLPLDVVPPNNQSLMTSTQGSAIERHTKPWWKIQMSIWFYPQLWPWTRRHRSTLIVGFKWSPWPYCMVLWSTGFVWSTPQCEFLVVFVIAALRTKPKWKVVFLILSHRGNTCLLAVWLPMCPWNHSQVFYGQHIYSMRCTFRLSSSSNNRDTLTSNETDSSGIFITTRECIQWCCTPTFPSSLGIPRDMIASVGISLPDLKMSRSFALFANAPHVYQGTQRQSLTTGNQQPEID